MAKGIMANSMMNAAAGMLLLITGFGCSIIAARFLGPEANGIIAFSLWLATTGALVAELGTGVLLLRMLPQLKAQGYSSARRRGFAALLLTPTLISTIILAILYAVVFIGSEEMHWAKTAPSIALVTGILFVIQSIGAFTKNYLIGEQRLGLFFRLTIVASVLQLALVLAGTLFYGVEGALVGYASGQVVMFVYTFTLIFRQRDRCDVPMNFLVSSSLILSAGFVLDSIFLNRIEILFLQQFWSVEMVGYYAVSLSLANLALQLPIQLTGSLLPYYSQRRHGDDNGTLSPDVFSGVIRALSYITLPMSFGLAAISGTLVTSVFGEAFRPAGMIVALLALSSPAYVLIQILTQYLYSIDRSKSRLFTALIGSAAIVIGCLAVVPWYGAEGAAIVRNCAFLLMCVLMIRQTGFGRSLSKLYVTLGKVAAASLAVAAGAYLTTDFIGGPAGLVAAILVGTIVYPVSLRLLQAVPVEDANVLLQVSQSMPGRLQNIFRRSILFIAPTAGKTFDDSIAKMNDNEHIAGTSGDIAEGAGNKAAVPVTFGGTVGLFMGESATSTPRDAAVLMLSPWGFEEMCTRKYFRILAERMAGIGVPSLRFDYPGTGDALGDPSSGHTLEDWDASIIAAAEKLRQLSGRAHIILLGHGPGAAFAQRLADRIEAISAIALLAPAMSGRGYLREIALMSKVVDQGLGLRENQRQTEGVSIAGFTMAEKVAEAIKAINLSSPERAGAGQYLILERPARMGDTSLRDGLQALGAEVRFDLFEGFDDLVANPTIQKMPMETVSKIVDWIAEINPEDTARARSLPVAQAMPLAGDGFSETPFRFGDADHLFGILCVPDQRLTDTSTLILTTAYDRNAGWGRSGTNTARALAKLGIASFRYDSANVGDSVPLADAPRQILYSETQKRDVTAALDLMETHLSGLLMIAGRCSGGYLALRSAAEDPRVTALLAVNPFVFYWDPQVPVHSGLQFMPRSLDDYGQRLARLDTLKRLVAGQINVRAAAKNIAIAVGRRLGRRLSWLMRLLPASRHVHREVKQTFRAYEQRNIPVSLIYSEGDVGLDDLHLHFGDQGQGVDSYSNVKLIMLPDTDHNITPANSKAVVFSEYVRLAKHGH